MQGHIQYVRDLLYEIPQEAQDDLEGEIDRLFLKQSMESFIREYADAGGWRNDPTLYIKIPLFATDHVLSQRESTPEGIRSDLLTLLAQIPAFLNVASRNLHRPSEISRQVALNMAGDAFDLHNRDIRAYIEEKIGGNEELLTKNHKVLEAWEQYQKELLQLPSRKSFAIGENDLEKILAISRI